MLSFEKWIRIGWVGAILIFTAIFCRQATDKFTLLAISSNHPYNDAFATPPLSQSEQVELEEAFDQPYTYFGCGGQSYAFFSADGKYVIKFFKQRLFRPSWLLNHLPLPKFLHRYREKRNWKRLDKYARDYFSYKVSSEDLREQTSVLYSHLNRTTHLNKEIKITDRLGISHNLNLDHFDFVVQRRAERVYDRIERLMHEGKQEEAKRCIQQIFSLISTRSLKGYRDRDPNIRTNCGFIEDLAVKIDVGRFVIDPTKQTIVGHNQDLTHITAPFYDWILVHYPELKGAFEESLQEALLR